MSERAESRDSAGRAEDGTVAARRTWPWAAGVATGVGSMPGTDFTEAVRTVLGELPDFPHVPELPARGPGAELVGRGAGFLVDLPVDLQPSGWRLVDRPGHDLRRTRDLLARDLDTLTDLAGDHRGLFKTQVCGPWTLAATVELHRGDKVLSDSGAVRDLVASLAEGVRAHVAELRRRLPGATVVAQLDEPALPAVLAGRVPTASGFDVLPTVEAHDAQGSLAAVVAAVDAPVLVHCCAAAVPWTLLGGVGVAGVAADLALVDSGDAAVLDALGAELDAGLGLVAGVLPGTDSPLSDPDATVRSMRTFWRRLGLDPALLPGEVVLATACGLAGATPGYARAVLAHCRQAARRLADDPEG